MTIVVIESGGGAVGCPLSELKTEFFERGFHYLNQDAAGIARAVRWINQSYLRICELYPWPFLEKEIESVNPIDITDLRAVLEVMNVGQGTKLSGVDHRDLTDRAVDLSIAGTPSVFYLESNVLNVYPSNTETLRVRYLYVPPALANDGDVTVMPSRFCNLIVDGAVMRAYRDTDNWEGYKELRACHQEEVFEMAASLMVRNHNNPSYIQMTDPDYY